MRPRPRSDAGFALLEVLVSLTLLSVGLVAVLTSVLAALDLQKDSAARFRAGLILQDKLAETLLEPYGGGTAHGVSDDGRFEWSVVGIPWNGAEERPADEADGEARIYMVVVDVGWRAGDGARHVSASELVAATVVREGAP